MKNSRKYPRVEASFPVEYTVADRKVRGRASILGGGGLFIKGESLPPGTELLLRFRPAKHLPIIQAKGKAVHHAPGQGTGVEFTRISPHDQQSLLRWIHHRRAERRTYPRVALVTQVYCAEYMSLAFSRDVSMGGMFIKMKDPPAAGSRVTLRFHLDDGGPIVVATADVRYIVPKLGVGVQFYDMPPADRRRLAAYVAEGTVLPEPKPNPTASP